MHVNKSKFQRESSSLVSHYVGHNEVNQGILE